jgi:hypothetical protein
LDYYFYPYVSLSGGGDGALDSLDGSLLKNGDGAFVIDPLTKITRIFTLDADSGATDDGLNVIAPDSNAGTKRWVLAPPTTLRDYVNVVDYGAVGTGLVDDTAAIQAAIDGLGSNGGTLSFPEGTFLISSLIFPNDPKVVNIAGAGINSTILQMGSAAGPMCHKIHSAGRITGAYFSDFTIKAHASSDHTDTSHMAWDVGGWNSSHWDRIAYKSNTGSVYSLFYISSDTYLTYKNWFTGIVATGNVGPASVIYTYAADAAHNTNLLYVRDCWIYANTHIDNVFNMSNCTNYSVTDCLIESNTGAVGILLGQSGYINGNWMESNLADYEIKFQATATVTSSANYIGRNNYFSGGTTLTIPDDCDFNLIDNRLITSISDSGAGNFHIDALATPAVPTIAVSVAGTLVATSAVVVKGVDSFSRSVTYKLGYTWTPNGAGIAKFTISAISGYSIVSNCVGCLLDGNGQPQPCGISSVTSEFWASCATTGAHSVTALVTFKK